MGSLYSIGKMPNPSCDVRRVLPTRNDSRRVSPSDYELEEVPSQRYGPPGASPTPYGCQKVSATSSGADHPFTTSWLLPPKALALLRLLISVYCFATMFTAWVWQGTHADAIAISQGFSYFTNLTWWGLSIYFLAASVHGFTYVMHGQSWLDRLPRLFQALHSFYYTTIVTFPILVTIVYWGMLRQTTWISVPFDKWLTVSKHGLNSFFALLEIFLTTTNPPPFPHIPFLWVVLGMYLGLTYITHWKQGWYPYNFLDPQGGNSNGRVAGYSFGIAAATLVIFLIVWAFIRLRRHATAGREWKSGKDMSGVDGNRMISNHARSDDLDLEMGR